MCEGVQNIGEVGMEPRQSRTNLDTREWSIIIPVWNLSFLSALFGNHGDVKTLYK